MFNDPKNCPSRHLAIWTKQFNVWFPGNLEIDGCKAKASWLTKNHLLKNKHPSVLSSHNLSYLLLQIKALLWSFEIFLHPLSCLIYSQDVAELLFPSIRPLAVRNQECHMLPWLPGRWMLLGRFLRAILPKIALRIEDLCCSHRTSGHDVKIHDAEFGGHEISFCNESWKVHLNIVISAMRHHLSRYTVVA